MRRDGIGQKKVMFKKTHVIFSNGLPGCRASTPCPQLCVLLSAQPFHPEHLHMLGLPTAMLWSGDTGDKPNSDGRAQAAALWGRSHPARSLNVPDRL